MCSPATCILPPFETLCPTLKTKKFQFPTNVPCYTCTTAWWESPPASRYRTRTLCLFFLVLCLGPFTSWRISSYPSHILPFPGRKREKKKKDHQITTNIIHRLQQQSSSYVKKTAVESRKVNSKSHLLGSARDHIKGYGILSSLSLHAFFQVHKMCFLQTAFLGLFPSHTNFPKVSFLFYAEMGIKRIKQMSPFLNSMHLHHIHT